jgi:hypothetical protein
MVTPLPKGDTPLTPTQIQSNAEQVDNEGYLRVVLVGFDQMWNTIIGGMPDETISAHVRRITDDPNAKHKLLAKVLNHMLNVIQPNHGARAEVGDLTRAENVLKTEQAALNIPNQ